MRPTSYDIILPQPPPGAEAASSSSKNPDLQDLISTTVDEKTLGIGGAPRRPRAGGGARLCQESSPRSELNAIAAFYQSEAGKKLLADGPIVTRELVKARRHLAERLGARPCPGRSARPLDKTVAIAKPAPWQPARPLGPGPEGAGGQAGSTGAEEPAQRRPRGDALLLPDTGLPGVDLAAAARPIDLRAS